MKWVANLYRVKDQGTNISVYHDRSEATDVANEWQNNKGIYQALMRRIETRSAAFEPIHRKAVSTARELKVAVDETNHSKRRVLALAERFLNQSDDASLLTQMQDVTRSSPELQDTQRLLDELTAYSERFSDDRESCFGIALALSGSTFEHPLIVENIDSIQYLSLIHI